MRVQEVERKIVARISGLEQEESQLQQWLDCLRRVEMIATQWQQTPTSLPSVDGMKEESEEGCRAAKEELEEACKELEASLGKESAMGRAQKSAEVLLAEIEQGEEYEQCEDPLDNGLDELRDRLVQSDLKGLGRQRAGFWSRFLEPAGNQD